MKKVFKYSILNSTSIKHNIIEKKKIIFNPLKKGKYLIQKNLNLKKKRFKYSSTQTRADVRGGGRKPWKQKGTGNARVGSIRSPIRRGGGIIFGPKPNIILKKINKKEKKLTLQTLLYNFRFNFIIFENLELFYQKTKSISSFLFQNNKILTLIILTQFTNFLQLAIQNLQNYKYIKLKQLTIKHLLKAKRIILDNSTLKQLIISKI